MSSGKQFKDYISEREKRRLKERHLWRMENPTESKHRFVFSEDKDMYNRWKKGYQSLYREFIKRFDEFEDVKYKKLRDPKNFIKYLKAGSIHDNDTYPINTPEDLEKHLFSKKKIKRSNKRSNKKYKKRSSKKY